MLATLRTKVHISQVCMRTYLQDVRARWAGVFWSSWAGVMHGRLPCVGHADAGMLHTGDPAGLGRLRRDRWPGVRPRSVSYSGGRAAMGGGNGR